jgi:site-specific DNA recombinase
VTIAARSRIRCAIYTRKSSEEGLEQSFNSLHAQREACEAYIASQRHEGWHAVATKYDDGAFSGGNMERPALQRLLADIAAKKLDTVVVHKVDRLTRSLADFAKIVEAFDAQGISFVSVTQQFNTTTSMGRLTLNVLLSFAQFEREVTGERIRDKIAASKKKGMWMGGNIPIGYDLKDHKLTIEPVGAAIVRKVYKAYLHLGCVRKLKEYVDRVGIRSPDRTCINGRKIGGAALSRGTLYHILGSRTYIGEIAHRGEIYAAAHEPIIDKELWGKVAAKLEENRITRHTRYNRPNGSVLMGLLFDVQGNRYMVTHTSKRGRRYRYYVVTTYRNQQPFQFPRLPAHEIEQVVYARIRALLDSPEELLSACQRAEQADLRQVTAAAQNKLLWLKSKPHKESAEFLRAIVKRVIIKTDEITIEIDVLTLLNTLTERKSSAAAAKGGQQNGAVMQLSAPIKMKRRGPELRLIIPGNQQSEMSPVPALVKTVARAHEWAERIFSGEISRIEDLAAETGFTHRYISRTLRPATLAPDLVSQILKGRQPPDLTVRKLLVGFPLDWESQRSLFDA